MALERFVNNDNDRQACVAVYQIDLERGGFLIEEA